MNLLSRPSGLDRRRFLKLGALTALSTLTDVPLGVRRALAESGLGRNGSKLIFVFLRGGNDSLNSLVPVGDEAYGPALRPVLHIPRDEAVDYSATGTCDFPETGSAPKKGTYSYPFAIRAGNGFTALHPSLKFLAPIYNLGEVALLHRVGYPLQSRSHFDSQHFWETGSPNDDTTRDGVFYRAIMESGLAHTAPLTGVSFQSSLPMCLRGTDAAMPNLYDTGRYNLLGIPNTAVGNTKADAALRRGMQSPYPAKRNRDLLQLQYQNLSDTLAIFSELDFSETGNVYRDIANTDGDTEPYHLFPTTNAKNGGALLHDNNADKFVAPPASSDFFRRLKAAAIVLNKTDAIVAGTELHGFDTHNRQGGVTGSHANLQRAIGWSIYALQRYFTQYADRVSWKKVVVVVFSEFGRTSRENSGQGTDHAEAGAMIVAGGGIQGFGRSAHGTGLFGASPADQANGVTVPWVTGGNGSLFGVSRRYLRRAIDYRSILGEVIGKHLGATPDQIQRILPGYADPAENLRTGGICGIDGTKILGEVGLL